MTYQNTHTLKRTTVDIAVKNTLRDMGKPVLEEVRQRLYKYYKCNISDCFDNPKYLRKVLKELYGNSYTSIIKSIERNLEKDIHSISIEHFLDVLNR